MAFFDIALSSFWIPSEENMVANAASRYDYTKLANLELQISHHESSIKASTLRQKLNIFFITPLHQQPVALITPQESPMNLSVGTTITSHSPCSSRRSRIGLPISWLAKPATAKHYISALRSSTNLASTLSSGVENGYMAKTLKGYDSHSQLQSFSEWSMRSGSMKRGLMSNRRSLCGICRLLTIWRIYMRCMIWTTSYIPSLMEIYLFCYRLNNSHPFHVQNWSLWQGY